MLYMYTCIVGRGNIAHNVLQCSRKRVQQLKKRNVIFFLNFDKKRKKNVRIVSQTV